MEQTTYQLYNRESLIKRFKNGTRPDENDFEALIASTINKLDDGISNSFNEGLQLAPQNEKIVSFYKNLNNDHPDWDIRLKGEKNAKALSFSSSSSSKALWSLHPNARVGLLNEDPQYTLDVSGAVAMQTRIGTFARGSLNADGNWHPVLKNQKGVQAFEIMAHAHGEKGRGKYALVHAFLMNAYAGRKGAVKKTQNYFGWKWWHRIRLRWTGTPFNYQLEMKTASDYGDDAVIEYHICKLL